MDTKQSQHPARHFVHHVVEMTIAMMLGMCILGMAFRTIHIALFGTGFDDSWRRHTELAVLAMTFNMTLPMVALMRYRGHTWRRSAEMGGAMFALALALLMPFWFGLVSARLVLPLEMALMLPTMIVVMLYRLDDYTRAHTGQQAALPRLHPAGPGR